MRVIKILSMTIKAFKGIKALTVNFPSDEMTIKGKNGSGKTTVYDAFVWLLFGKNSDGATKFDVKPLDKDGKKVTGVDTEVEATLDVDGKKIKLKKVLHERWKKMGGESVYTGDETQCYIDDVPSKIDKEYSPYVAAMVGQEDIFRMLSIHGAFMELAWTERRKYLMNAAGDDVSGKILSQSAYQAIADAVSEHGAVQARKGLNDQRKKLTEQLNSIPYRIDELRKSSSVDEKQHSDDAVRKEELIKELSALSGKGLDERAEELNRQQVSLMGQIINIERRIRDEAMKPVVEANKEIIQRKMDLDSALFEITDGEAKKKRLADDCDRLKAEREKYLAQWNDEYSKEFIPKEMTGSCPYCGAAYSREKVDQIRENEKVEFMQSRKRVLEGIRKAGKSTADQIIRVQSEIEKVEDRVIEASARRKEAEKRIEELNKMLSQKQEVDFSRDAEWTEKSAKLAVVKDSINALQEEDQREFLDEERAEKQKELDAINERNGVYEHGLEVKKRIVELEEEQRRIGATIVAINGKIDLIAQFMKAVSDSMEDKINALFTTIRWKLYDFQKNGECVPCCVCTVNGVPYETGLNHAAKINAGVEIIRVLSKEIGVSVPCFVDNAEAVNSLEFTGGQMIRLVVSDDSELVMEE